MEGKPFFVSMNFQTSHFPYEIPNEWKGPFQPAALHSGSSFTSYPRAEAAVVKNAYFNALRYIDQQIGFLVSYLRKAGLRESTIICVTGDHGEAFYENGENTHGTSPIETVTKVGLVLNCPGFIEPRSDRYLAQAIDLVPTVIRLVGCDPSPAFQGIDLFSPDRIAVAERLAFIHSRNPLASKDAVISGTGWKYVFDHLKRRGYLYFRPTDLEYHPSLAGTEPEVTAILHETLAEWRQRQLLYYASPRYFTLFYPPQEPKIGEGKLAYLKQRAQQLR